LGFELEQGHAINQDPTLHERDVTFISHAHGEPAQVSGRMRPHVVDNGVTRGRGIYPVLELFG
jgi:hypothetical protein